jgi:hypothetical protein
VPSAVAKVTASMRWAGVMRFAVLDRDGEALREPPEHRAGYASYR